MMEGVPKNQTGSIDKIVEKVGEEVGKKAGGFMAKQALNFATAGLVGLTSVGDVLANPEQEQEILNNETEQVTQINTEVPKPNLEVPRKKPEEVKDVSVSNFEGQPEVLFSEETKNSMKALVDSLDKQVLDFKYQVDIKKEDVERGFDSALVEMNACISNLEKTTSGDFSKKCKDQVGQVQVLFGEYKAGHIENDILLNKALHVRQIFHGYLDAYNERRDEWLNQNASK